MESSKLSCPKTLHCIVNTGAGDTNTAQELRQPDASQQLQPATEPGPAAALPEQRALIAAARPLQHSRAGPDQPSGWRARHRRPLAWHAAFPVGRVMFCSAAPVLLLCCR
jgi:hypothetical protein